MDRPGHKAAGTARITKTNIRMTSLPADRAVASHDCPTCVKRRIKCDRSQPACFKCASRKLACPGFKTVYLKWDQGIASRGKFAGKSTPAASSSTDQDQNKDPPSPTRDDDMARTLLSTSIFRTLIHHFCTKAISRLTWVDQPSHPWRDIVRNLLGHSTCLQLSVGSLAAAHLSMTPDTSSSHSRGLFGMYCSLRDQSLRLLSAKMQRRHSQQQRQQEQQQQQNHRLPDTDTDILASMLALCYAEVLVPGSLTWKVHLRACRAVIQHQSPTPAPASDTILSFLLKEIADLEVFAATGTFEDHSPPVPATSVSGWAFTSLIGNITALERRRHSHPSPPPLDITPWLSSVHSAYERTMACPTLLSATTPPATQRNFEALTRAYRSATLLYSYEAFDVPIAREPLVHALLDDVQAIVSGPTDDLFHDLCFPLFIAGVESSHDRERQVLIDGLFMESLQRGGIWCNYSALQFLRTFWAPPAAMERRAHWIEFARANLASVGTFIIL